MAKKKIIGSASRLCADSRDLIEQSNLMIIGSGAACAAHRDQIGKSREAVAKSREQILRLRLR